MDKKQEKENSIKKVELPKLKGKYISTIGRRKRSVARVRLYKKGDGVIIVNGKSVRDYFSEVNFSALLAPLKLTNHVKDLNFSIIVTGGGPVGQAGAIRHGITRSLLELDEDLKIQLKAKGWLTRDARKKERKKPGLKKARRAPQWSKR